MPTEESQESNSDKDLCQSVQEVHGFLGLAAQEETAKADKPPDPSPSAAQMESREGGTGTVTEDQADENDANSADGDGESLVQQAAGAGGAGPPGPQPESQPPSPPVPRSASASTQTEGQEADPPTPLVEVQVVGTQTETDKYEEIRRLEAAKTEAIRREREAAREEAWEREREKLKLGLARETSERESKERAAMEARKEIHQLQLRVAEGDKAMAQLELDLTERVNKADSERRAAQELCTMSTRKCREVQCEQERADREVVQLREQVGHLALMLQRERLRAGQTDLSNPVEDSTGEVVLSMDRGSEWLSSDTIQIGDFQEDTTGLSTRCSQKSHLSAILSTEVMLTRREKSMQEREVSLRESEADHQVQKMELEVRLTELNRREGEMITSFADREARLSSRSTEIEAKCLEVYTRESELAARAAVLEAWKAEQDRRLAKQDKAHREWVRENESVLDKRTKEIEKWQDKRAKEFTTHELALDKRLKSLSQGEGKFNRMMQDFFLAQHLEAKNRAESTPAPTPTTKSGGKKAKKDPPHHQAPKQRKSPKTTATQPNPAPPGSASSSPYSTPLALRAAAKKAFLGPANGWDNTVSLPLSDPSPTTHTREEATGGPPPQSPYDAGMGLAVGEPPEWGGMGGSGTGSGWIEHQQQKRASPGHPGRQPQPQAQQLPGAADRVNAVGEVECVGAQAPPIVAADDQNEMGSGRHRLYAMVDEARGIRTQPRRDSGPKSPPSSAHSSERSQHSQHSQHSQPSQHSQHSQHSHHSNQSPNSPSSQTAQHAQQPGFPTLSPFDHPGHTGYGGEQPELPQNGRKQVTFSPVDAL